MAEEILVEDNIEECESADTKSGARPMLYIQQNINVCPTQQMATSQAIVPQSAPQLTAIINPVANQIGNKVFIQGANQAASCPSKQHIVYRPINATNVSAAINVTNAHLQQKHILLKKSTSSTAQIVPLNTAATNSQPNAPYRKPAFAYFINSKARNIIEVSGVGGLPTTKLGKSKLVIAPVISPQADTAATAPQNSSAKHILVPVPVLPQPSSPRPSMFNLKINNVPNNNDAKGTITVLRESKTTNATTHPPPLHPITKMSLIGAAKSNSSTSDSIKITENPDSAVITPIPKEEEVTPPETKLKKKISNILRTSNEKRAKKQNLRKLTSQEMLHDMDMAYRLMSPEEEQKEVQMREQMRMQNNDDITLIKVVGSEEKLMKLPAMDDDIKIELIKTNSIDRTQDIKSEIAIPKREDSSSASSETEADVSKCVDWNEGSGSISGCAMKFHMNEFGFMEVVDEEDNKQDKDNNIGDKENVCLSQNSTKVSSTSSTGEKKSEERRVRSVSSDTFYCCQGCGCHGLASEFESLISCSPSCTEIIETKKQQALRKEKDLKEIRAKRKRKKLLQDQQLKDDKKEDEKIDSPEKPKSEDDEDTKDTTTGMDDERAESPTESRPYPWLTGKLGFSWAKYLEFTKAKAAPVKLFKDPFPYTKNQFRVGMKLEGIDPDHPSRYCVLTVVEIVGYRLRLHFDGYSESFDFWVNADSMDIFPVGRAEKNGHKLNPPKNYVASNFNWNVYLRVCKATAAPKNIFSKNTVFPTGFRVGMKLEAVDRKHSSLVCVASVAGLMDSRILVHFDSWSKCYDYWADVTSPYIHPVGWCQQNGINLTPPNSYADSKSFTWDEYLKDTRSVAAPARAFKQKPASGFKRGMKLEAVDERVPQLIRVATVEEVKDHMLKIHFDGWPENHAYWVDDDSTDIHPMGWCAKTGHPLEPPLTADNVNEFSECGTPGCRGTGHIKGPKFATHNSPSGCPYSAQNLNKNRTMTDRLNYKYENHNFEDGGSLAKPEKKMDFFRRKSSSEEKITKNERSATTKSEDDNSNDKEDSSNRCSKRLLNDEEDDDTLRKRKKRTLRQNSEESMSHSNSTDSPPNSTLHNLSIPDKQLRMDLYNSVYNPGYNPSPDPPHAWEKHCNALNRVVSKQTTNPRRWSNEEVIKFVQSVPNCRDFGSVFRKHNIDGEAFLMLTQEDLVSLLKLRLGPALKLYNSIVLLRRRVS